MRPETPLTAASPAPTSVQLFIEVVTLLLILLFAYTGLMKITENARFAYTMNDNPLIEPYTNTLRFAVPSIELITVALLLTRKTRRTGLLVSTILLLAFTCYVAVMLATQSHLPCSCGGIIEYLDWKQHLIINTMLTIAGGAAYALHRKNYRDKQA